MTPADLQITRRSFLNHSSAGIGSVALASLLNDDLEASDSAEKWTGVIKKPHHPPKAKRVIHLCMAGGPSHLETLDYKPELAKMNGKPMPQSFTKGQPIAQLQGQRNNLKVLGPQHEFKHFGKSGQHISSILPEIGSVADEIAIVRSMVTEQINHDPAHTFMNTGTQISGRPSMGSWLLYGLGAETENLPGYVVLTSVGGGQNQPIAARQWHSGFLPSRFQGVPFHSKGDPVLYVTNPKGVSKDDQRALVNTVNALNGIHNQQAEDPEIAARIAQYEMAFKMQASVPGLMDVSDEPQHILDLYGAKPGDGSFASNCLLARRLAERGVRFIQLYHRGWDHHGGIKNASKNTAGLVDRGSAALIKDLKERGMLDDTLVIWGGEFGRTPMAQGNGRDHHIKGFSMWMAGGGIKGGVSHGATDELGYNSVQDIVNVRDLHATLLHLFGIDYKRFSHKFQGLDYRLTGVKPASVVKPILA